LSHYGRQLFWGCNIGAFTVGLAAAPPSADTIRHVVVLDAHSFSGGATDGACTLVVVVPPPSTGPIRHVVVGMPTASNHVIDVHSK